MNEINFNVGNLAALQAAQMTELAAQTADKISGGRDLFSVSVADMAPTDGLEAVSDSALTRDDPLGKIVAQAFDGLPVPPMPVFREA